MRKKGDGPPCVGLVMDYFRPELLEGARCYCAEHYLRLDARWSVRSHWFDEQVDWAGALFNLVDDRATLERMRAKGFPLVALHGNTAEGWPAVLTDWQACGALAVDALLEAELRPVLGFVEDAQGKLSCMAKAFAQGVHQRLCQHGREDLWRPLVLPADASALSTIVEILHKAIVAADVPVALPYPHSGVMFSLQLALEESGVVIPRDLSIVTVDKDVQRTAELALVPLTTVKLDEWTQGYRAAEMLHALIEQRQIAEERIQIAPLTIETRESTMRVLPRDPYVQRALELIERMYSQKLLVSEIALRLHLGRRTLETRFRTEVGRTVQEEILRRRLEESMRLLRHGTLGIAEIADRCGFSSVHYFSNVFKRETGMSPGKWKDSF